MEAAVDGDGTDGRTWTTFTLPAVLFANDILRNTTEYDEGTQHIGREGRFSKTPSSQPASRGSPLWEEWDTSQAPSPLPQMVETLKDFSHYTTKKKVRQFLGHNFYHHIFIPSTTTILSPLHALHDMVI